MSTTGKRNLATSSLLTALTIATLTAYIPLEIRTCFSLWSCNNSDFQTLYCCFVCNRRTYARRRDLTQNATMIRFFLVLYCNFPRHRIIDKIQNFLVPCYDVISCFTSRLLFLARKTHILKFNLNSLLTVCNSKFSFILVIR